MRTTGSVTAEEMRERFPAAMAALAAEQEGEVDYCLNCDGLRTHSTATCPYHDPFKS